MRLFPFALFMLYAVPALAQPPVTVTTQNAAVDALTPADIDFYHSASPKWLFTIDLRTQQASVEVTMTIRLDLSLGNGDVIPEAVYLTTYPFAVAPARTFTNLDLANSPLVNEYRIKNDIKEKYAEDLRSSQVLPAGTYTVHVEVFPTGQNTSQTSAFAFVLTNPTAIELVAPLDGDQMVNRFPLFQWRFDGTRSRINVYERLPGQGSLEESASGVPHLRFEATTNSYQYPSAGVRALEPGTSYVWYVEGLARTAGNTSASLRSELRSFTVAGEGATTMQTYLDELERALGPKYTHLFDQIRAERLNPTGTLRINGVAISSVDLLRLIGQFRNDPVAVLNVTIE
jgi:hypothetical protein